MSHNVNTTLWYHKMLSETYNTYQRNNNFPLFRSGIEFSGLKLIGSKQITLRLVSIFVINSKMWGVIQTSIRHHGSLAVVTRKPTLLCCSTR